ncbi:MAG: hypothetical protein ACR2LR_08670 [Hassallia sp.]
MCRIAVLQWLFTGSLPSDFLTSDPLYEGEGKTLRANDNHEEFQY